MNDQTPDPADDASELEAARRTKLNRLIQLGLDPYGQRFDDRSWIGDIRQRTGEIQFHRESGETVELPNQLDQEDFDFRGWLKEQGSGELKGPQVRAAGRILLHRDKGKLQFIDIQDWTGQIQLFVGRKQVGDENWEVIQCLDLGDLIGVDGVLRRTQTGELLHLRVEDPRPLQNAGSATR